MFRAELIGQRTGRLGGKLRIGQQVAYETQAFRMLPNLFAQQHVNHHAKLVRVGRPVLHDRTHPPDDLNLCVQRVGDFEFPAQIQDSGGCSHVRQREIQQKNQYTQAMSIHVGKYIAIHRGAARYTMLRTMQGVVGPRKSRL